MKILSAFLFAVVFSLLGNVAQAHTFRADGPIGVTTHIEPNDAPVAGEQASLFVEVNNSNDDAVTFCECEVSIEQAGRILYSVPLGNRILHQPIIFPESGAAKITVRGTFGSLFETSFDYYISSGTGVTAVRAPENKLQIYSPYITMIGIGSILLLFIFRKH